MLFCFVQLEAIDIDDKSESYDLLSKSKIYIDYNNSSQLEDILKNKSVFKENKKDLLAYGYAPEFTIWIKFTLTNTTSNILYKTIEYANPLTTHVNFYSPSDAYVKKEGLYQIDENRKTINPIFKITLAPQESKIFYIQASSHITTLIVKLKLWNQDSFYEKEIVHQLILGLFFAAMSILAIYNLFIYFFTKDISYLYYVLYLFGIISHHFIYIGMANVYIFNQLWIQNFVEMAAFLVAFPIYFLALFTKSFLQLKQYYILNKILYIYLLIFPFLVYIFILLDDFSKLRNIFTYILLLYLVLITLYTAYKHNRQSYFILFGWIVVLIAGTVMFTSSIALFNFNLSQYYIVEIAFVLEAVIFSIALADKIKQLQKEKNHANNQLILQQKNETIKLENQVQEKTITLRNNLNEKEMLLKELNHRVKNNMQTIISLIRLQLDDIDDLYVKNILSTTYNRVTAMSHLHEMLYYQTDISHINAYEYFSLLVDEIQESYTHDINISLEIHTELEIDQAIYCGLILNELTTNAFKHAFKSNSGNIRISLSKKHDTYTLVVIDDGIGYKKKKATHSLGLVLVNSLVRSKLKGQIKMESVDGLKVEIIWKDTSE